MWPLQEYQRLINIKITEFSHPEFDDEEESEHLDSDELEEDDDFSDSEEQYSAMITEITHEEEQRLLERDALKAELIMLKKEKIEHLRHSIDMHK